MRSTHKQDKIFIVFLFLLLISSITFLSLKDITTPWKSNLVKEKQDLKLIFLFTGDIFLDRHIDELSQKSKLKYAYPFSGLYTLHRENYDAWIGNLECPVTDEQSTKYEKENYLKFSCKKGYLPELAKYFDIVSLANNHTNNMNGREGINETRKHLQDAGIKYFGDFDNSQRDYVCKIIFISTKNFSNKIPMVFCGFHGVYKLPTSEELEIIKEYSKYFITFVMPHQGEEYKFKSNTYQQKIYRQMIDNGADAVIGSHPHVIEEVEDYKGKKIFYSLGNFIFDQSWSKTREHMEVDLDVTLLKYNNNYEKLNCDRLKTLDCLALAKTLQIEKPEYKFDFEKIYTYSNLDFITKLKD